MPKLKYLCHILFSALLGTQPTFAALPSFNGEAALPSLAPMLEKVMPAVVNVSVSAVSAQHSSLFQDPFFRQFFELPEAQPRSEQSAGSGVIINSREGYIVTNHHVIEDAEKIKITLYNGQELSAELVGSDEATDIALLQVQSNQLQQFPLGDADALRIGDFVVAVGNPFGLGHSVTSGIVSALGRSGLGIERYEDFIQTDASINPGNSGGALVNLRGELIGINTAILAPGGGNIGIGFAIPINRVQKLTEQLLQYGDIQRGVLGVLSADLPSHYRIEPKAPTSKGALIIEIVPRSPADKAGLQVGDIVVAIGDEAIDTASDLRNTLGLVRAGDARIVKFWRGDRLKEENVLISDPSAQRKIRDSIYQSLAGAKFLDVTLSTRNGPRGAILVSELQRGAPAISTGLQRDDLIVAVNDQTIDTLTELRQWIDQASGSLDISVQRDDQLIKIPLK